MRPIIVAKSEDGCPPPEGVDRPETSDEEPVSASPFEGGADPTFTRATGTETRFSLAGLPKTPEGRLPSAAAPEKDAPWPYAAGSRFTGFPFSREAIFNNNLINRHSNNNLINRHSVAGRTRTVARTVGSDQGQ